MECKYCNKETKNPKFCNRSCATSFNNKKENFPKRKPTKKCKSCSKIIDSRSYYCSNKCKPKISSEKLLSEVIYDSHHRSSAFALVRTGARAIAKKLKLNICKKCGYSKHVEICHIKAIKDFSLDVPVKEINDINNLIPLCPNCHWEFDNLN